MRARAITLLLLLLLPPTAFAGNKQADEQQTAEELPDAELLEFIAEFEPLDGQWIDPIQLNMIFAENRNGKENE
jgi:hypothetical protein